MKDPIMRFRGIALQVALQMVTDSLCSPAYSPQRCELCLGVFWGGGPTLRDAS